MKTVIEFLKTLLGYDDTELNVLLYSDQTAEETSSTFRIRPKFLWRLIYAAAVAIIIVVIVLIAFTPLKRVLVPGVQPGLKKELVQLSRKVGALEDTLKMRDRQLTQMKKVILKGEDTTFTVSQQPVKKPSSEVKTTAKSISLQPFYTPIKPQELIAQQDIIKSKRVNRSPVFPTRYPVEGTLTRGVIRERGHFGIDISTATGAPVLAIADGTVISSSWSPNYGYVVRIQHGNGYMSVYKHCQSLIFEEGDIVQKGDIIGEVGDAGLLSSGPHLHFELWREGFPLDPKPFLTQN